MLLTKETINIDKYMVADNLYPEITGETSLFLHGDIGSGKTFKVKQLACNLLEKIDGNYSCDVRFVDFNDMCKKAFDSFSKDTHTKAMGNLEFKDFKECFLLTIDKLPFENVTDARKALFENIIEYRIENNLPFYITSIASLEKLRKYYPESLIERIQNTCTQYICNKKPTNSQIIKVQIPKPTPSVDTSQSDSNTNDNAEAFLNSLLARLCTLKGIAQANTPLASQWLKVTKLQAKDSEKTIDSFLPCLRDANKENILSKIDHAIRVVEHKINNKKPA